MTLKNSFSENKILVVKQPRKMLSIHHRVLIVVALLIIVLSNSCNKCEDETRVFGDLRLRESALDIINILEPEQLTYIDSIGREILLVRTNFESAFKRISSGRYVCEEGEISEGYYLAEDRTSLYLGDDIQIRLSIKALSDELARGEGESDLNKTTGIDYMDVEVIINGCDTLSSRRAIQETISGEPTIRFNPIPFRKFGQVHRNRFRLMSFPYEGDMMFTKEKGLVAFNYCDVSLVQVGE